MRSIEMAKKKRKLPKDVFLYRGQLVYWPYLGCFNGKGKRGTRVILGPSDLPEGKIYQLLDQVKETRRKTVEWLLSAYMESEKFKKLSKSTRHNRKEVYYPKIIDRRGPNNGTRFGDLLLNNITPAMLLRLLKTFEGNPTRNQIKTFISAAWSWGILEHEDIPRQNPAKEVPNFEEESRTFYITDELYRKVRRTMKPFYRAAMEIAYQCRAREIEIFALTYNDLLKEGIYLKRAKGSISEITLWNRRLRTAVAMVKSICTNKHSEYLFHEPDGSPIEPQRFACRFKDCMRRRVAAGKITPEERFTFHDMKAKGVSDHEGQYSGHRTETGRKIYIRKAPKIKGSK
ncbi:hypothetical protein [Endozoicomonas sp. ALE010]|uniref:hypothetical protein n=1 Tax=Endozoicomonas sp. ALE010 TaxID=3403081 RepID=UPI003BB6BF70